MTHASRSSRRPRLRHVVLLALAALTAGFTSACDDDTASGPCANGECVCVAGANCNIWCDAPPCHVLCEGNNDCRAECANGDCKCGPRSKCDFRCAAPPCHVDCAANTACSGECANGSCKCGANSSCDFTCTSGPCHSDCGPGASCLLTCPSGSQDTRNCRFDRCDGTPRVCLDGKTLACNADCPKG